MNIVKFASVPLLAFTIAVPGQTSPLDNHKIPYNIEQMMGFNTVPNCRAAGGVVVYLSTQSCNILIDHFTSIEWNVFKKDDVYGYPYIIEDIAIGYVLFINNVFLTQYPLYIDSGKSGFIDNGVSVAIHTNKYK